MRNRVCSIEIRPNEQTRGLDTGATVIKTVTGQQFNLENLPKRLVVWNPIIIDGSVQPPDKKKQNLGWWVLNFIVFSGWNRRLHSGMRRLSGVFQLCKMLRSLNYCIVLCQSKKEVLIIENFFKHAPLLRAPFEYYWVANVLGPSSPLPESLSVVPVVH